VLITGGLRRSTLTQSIRTDHAKGDIDMTAHDAPRSLQGILPQKTVGGLVLVAIGLVIIASWAIPGFGQYALLAVGIVCLVAFALTREYGYAVATGITGGLGVGVVLSSMASDPYDGVIFMASFAAGFLAVWLLGFGAKPRETNLWPLIPAVLFGAIAITIVTESSLLLDALLVVAVVSLIGGGLKAIRDARKA
jgi:hypothetical protein